MVPNMAVDEDSALRGLKGVRVFLEFPAWFGLIGENSPKSAVFHLTIFEYLRVLNGIWASRHVRYDFWFYGLHVCALIH